MRIRSLLIGAVSLFCLYGYAIGVGTLVVATESACRSIPTTIETPSGRAAYQLEDAVDAVNTLQHAAIVGQRNGKISVETVQTIIRYRRATVTAIDRVIDNGTGKDAALRNALEGLIAVETAIQPAEKSALKAALDALQNVLRALEGN